MKKTIILAVLLLSIIDARAYDFSAVAPTGQRLYYYIIGNSAQVTFPTADNLWHGYTKPSGDLIIPDIVTDSASGISYPVTEIDTAAFYTCTDITSVTIGDSMRIIWEWAFHGCGLTWVTFGNSLIVIGNYAFADCNSLTSIVIPNSVTTIGEGAFLSCHRLSSVTIGNSVTTIGEGAFGYCNNLISVVIPNTVVSIGVNAFRLVKIIVYDGNATGSPWGAYTVNGIVDGDFVYTDSSQTVLAAYIGTSSVVSVPDSVLVIGPYAFYENMDYYENTDLTSVTIPNSVIEIRNHAFDGCGNLETVTLPGSLRRIGEEAFAACWHITSLTIGDRVTSIGNSAFEYCIRLKSVTVGSSVDSIGNAAFLGCNSLTEVNYTGTVDQWCGIHFGNLLSNPIERAHSLKINGVSVTELQVGANVTEIKQFAFFGCTSLTSVTLASSVAHIGQGAFGSCDSIMEVHVRNYVPPTVEIYNDINPAIVYVPCGAISDYQSANFWSQFPLTEEFSYSISAFPDDITRGTVQVSGTPTCANPQVMIHARAFGGYHFTRWSDGDTNDTRTVTISSDTVFVACFEADSSPVGIDDSEMTDNPLLVTVADGRIQVLMNGQPVDEFGVYDVLGREVFHALHADKTSVLPNGVYLVRIATPSGTATKKLLVQRR